MSTKEEILDYVMDSPSNTNRSVLDSLLNNFAGEKEIQYVDFTLVDGSITAPADDTVLTICNMDDSNILVVARILSSGSIYCMPLTWRATPGNIILVAFSISSNGDNHQLTGQRYPNNTEKWSYSAAKIDYIPDEGNVGDVLKKTTTGCEWGTAGGGGSDFLVIPIIPGEEEETFSTTTTCGELKAAINSSKMVIMCMTVESYKFPIFAMSNAQQAPGRSYISYNCSATDPEGGMFTAKNEVLDGKTWTEIPDADPLAISYTEPAPEG